MAYAAVVSLVETLKQLLHNSDHPSIQYIKPEVESFLEKLSSLQPPLSKIYAVKISERERVGKLENDIRDAAYKAQDAVESYISKQIFSSDSHEIPPLSQELQELGEQMDPLTKSAMETAASLEIQPEVAPRPARNFAFTPKTDIVGQEKDFKIIMDQVDANSSKLEVISITGMPGIGKTTLGRSIYDDPKVKEGFDVRSWVTVTSESNLGDILSKLLANIETPNTQKEQTSDLMGDRKSVDDLRNQLHQKLYNQKYLVVVDDMWDISTWKSVQSSFKDDNKGSRILLTTRSKEIAKLAVTGSGVPHQMQPLSLENSWILLQKKVYAAGGSCPLNLQETGKNIAKNCKGLPLLIVVIGGQLSQSEQTLNYWQRVEDDVRAAGPKNQQEGREMTYEEIMDILSVSYNHLPARLKGCFLYMSGFPEDSDIPMSKLIILWVAEGFLSPSHQKIEEQVEQSAEQSLNDLVNRNLIVSRRTSSRGQMKTCGIHDSLRDLSVKISRGEKYFHFISRYIRQLGEDEASKKDAASQRRLAIHRNILMCMEEVYETAAQIKPARTLLYAGTHHHHPMPSCLTFENLRVLDAFTVYFIEFPHDILKLFHLRYLSLTYNGKLPASISKLRNLQILIVRRLPKIIFIGASILPDEIWSMPQLRHLLFTESELPKLPEGEISSVLLENLQSLTNVRAVCCTKEVLKNTPNLKKLGMWIEGPCDLCFYVNDLEQLEFFKFKVLNPIPGTPVNFKEKFDLPKTLKKLTLSGCGLPWDYMKTIEKLSYLEVLKLRELAFHGAMWELNIGFPKLKFLLLEALNLELWGAEDEEGDGILHKRLPSLECLKIRHCYELEDFPPEIGKIGRLQLIEMVECSPTAVKSLEEIKDKLKTKKHLEIRIFSSWK